MQRLFLTFWLFLATVLSAAPTTPPNVLLIVSDDQGWGDYGFMGHPLAVTPSIDKLAAQSLCFKNGYVSSSLCCPSLASLITGKYPHQHGITGNDPSVDHTGGPYTKTPEFAVGRERMKELIHASATLPRELGSQLGYRSQQTGKWWLGSFADGGFTEGMTLGDPSKGGRHGDAGLNIGRKGLEPIYDFIHRTKAEAKPFFVWYAPMMPHEPHNPPAEILARYLAKTADPFEAGYLAMVEWFDQTCGELLSFLDRENLAENTLVVYICDNGWIQNPNARGFAPKSKQSPNEGGLRTPILLRWPAKIKPAMPDSLASAVDLMPTILRACGAKVPDACEGIDLLDEKAVAARHEVFGAGYDHDMVDLGDPARSLKWRWTRAGDWKLILPGSRVPGAKPELYNVAMDPTEIHDLAASQAGRVEELTRQIDSWWTPKEP